jgi:hypothetical protein
MLRACEAMGLEGDEQPARSESFESLEGRPNLRWMMSVIIKNPKAIVREKLLLPPCCAAKSFDGASNFVRRKAELVQERHDGGDVGNILFAKQMS